MTGAYNRFIYLHYATISLYTLLQIYKLGDYVASVPYHLRGPPPQTPSRAPLLPPPLVTPANAGSDVLGSSHQLWHWNPTTGHRRHDAPHLLPLHPA